MKMIILIPAVLIAQYALCQSDTLDGVDAEYMENIYNPETRSINHSCNYSNRWDLDGDGKNDPLYFIGNGGAHAYYYLRVTLSSQPVTRDFTSIQLDMPYVQPPAQLSDCGKCPAIQFVVSDFDKDGIADLYLNFNNPFGSVPCLFRQKGVRSKYIILGFPGGKMNVRDY